MTNSKPDYRPGAALRPPEAVLTDYADLGTAFGLDATVGSGCGLYPEPAVVHSPTELPWEYRLTRRTGL